MRKVLLSMVAAFVMTTAMAQTTVSKTEEQQSSHMDPTEMIQKRTDQMVQKYGLSAEQAAKLKTLNEKYMKGPHGGMKKGERPEPPKDMEGRPEMPKDSIGGGYHGRGHHGRRGPHFDVKAYNTKLQTIMTADQYKAYEADMEKFRKH